MRDYMELGSAPYEEECVQVGSDNYYGRMMEECRRYKEQLQRDIPIPEGVDAHYKIKTFQHDFGPYAEVCVVYDNEDEKTFDFIDTIEDRLPANWRDAV